jgi:hypothetical protein
MGKRRKRKIFSSPEERAAWEAAFEERQRELRGHIERIKAEVTKGMTAQEREAYEELHRDSGRALRYYIDRAKAEQEERRKSA